MFFHGLMGSIRVRSPKGGKQAIVLFKRLLCDAAVEHEAKDMQVDMLVIQSLPDKLIIRHPQNLVMEMRIRPCKARIPAVAINRGGALFHVRRGALDPGERVRRQL